MRHIKVRNLRSERLCYIFGDALVIFAVLLTAWLCRPQCGPIGNRTMALLHGAQGGLVMAFLYLMDKYRSVGIGRWEKTVITALCIFYSTAVLCVLNLVFFGSGRKADY